APPTNGLAPIGGVTATRIAADLVADLRSTAAALRTRDRAAVRDGATGEWLSELWSRIDRAKGESIDVPGYDAKRGALRLEPGKGQDPRPALRTLPAKR